MVRRQFPAGAVGSGFEAVSGPQVPAEHLGAIPALEADDMILLDRAPDRHGWLGLFLRRGHSAPESGEPAMHLGNQAGELVGPDLVMPDITADDARDPIGSNLRRHILFGHRIFLDLSILILAEQDSIPTIILMNFHQTTEILRIFVDFRSRVQ